MTSFQWPLAQVWLEGRRVLSKIVTWCSEHTKSFEEDSRLEGIPKNPYHHIKQQNLSLTVESKLKRKSGDADVQKVSSIRIYKYRCSKKFSLNDTLYLTSKFYTTHSKVARRLLMQCKGNCTHYLNNERNSLLLVTTRFKRMLGT